MTEEQQEKDQYSNLVLTRLVFLSPGTGPSSEGYDWRIRCRLSLDFYYVFLVNFPLACKPTWLGKTSGNDRKQLREGEGDKVRRFVKERTGFCLV